MLIKCRPSGRISERSSRLTIECKMLRICSLLFRGTSAFSFYADRIPEMGLDGIMLTRFERLRALGGLCLRKDSGSIPGMHSRNTASEYANIGCSGR